MTRQLAFDLPHRNALGRDAFFVSESNRDAAAALDAWRDWPGGKTVLLGPPGSGKTHLAQIWAEATGAPTVAARGLADADVPALARAALVVEDCADLARDRAGQVALFHLHNLLAGASRPLLLTADGPPRAWGLTLPDLASRMEAAPVARLAAPDDAALAAVIVKLFADRQLVVAPAVVTYLLTRMDRSFAAARALVAELDSAALARGSAITRPLATEVMDKGQGG